MDRTRLLTAFQVLSMPEGAYPGATHELAHYTIHELTGRFAQGRPPSGGRSLDEYLAWLETHHLTAPSTARYQIVFEDGYEDPWEGSWEELREANSEDLGVLEPVSALAPGESCTLGGGAAPLVTTTRLS